MASRPIFDAICSMCGCLLYGGESASGVTNKRYGPPADRDGKILLEEGVPQTRAQPPFLLRYSPQLFASECAAAFKHDPQTNKLSIREGMTEPWLRPAGSRAADAHKSTWYYCLDCHEHHFSTKKGNGHLPYRDKASQWLMKKPAPREVAEPSQGSVGEPEVEPTELMDIDHESNPDLDENQEVHEDAAQEADEQEEREDLPDKVYPTLEEYQRKWSEGLARHSRPNPGDFNRSNLVPDPIPQLWQDALGLVRRCACLCACLLRIWLHRPLEGRTTKCGRKKQNCVRRSHTCLSTS